jgi:hypothetical protein
MPIKNKPALLACALMLAITSGCSHPPPPHPDRNGSNTTVPSPSTGGTPLPSSTAATPTAATPTAGTPTGGTPTGAAPSGAAPTGAKARLSSPVAVPSKDVLTAALLTAAELPGSYTVLPSPDAPAAQLGTGVQGCSGASADPAPKVTALVVYQGGPVGPFIAEAISGSDQDTAVRTMQGLQQVVANCSRFGSELPGGIKVEIAIDQLTFPRIGDDLVAFRLTETLTGAGAALYAHVVYVRTGQFVVVSTLMQISSPDVATTESLVRAAVAKADKQLRRT